MEAEIARLLESPLVALARKEESIRNRRRQYMYKLRNYEKTGRKLAEAWITMDMILNIGTDYE